MSSPSCPHPFLAEALFPSTAGSVSGRWCEQLGEVSCCLPCPILPWRWGTLASWLIDTARVQLWLGLPILILLVWLLVTYAVFPATVTDRHYLSVTPVIGFVCITVAFIVPSKGQPRECYNQITPNDMHTDARCALMGVVLFFGAWLVVLSCFFRSVALHFSVVWEILPGPIFKYTSLGLSFFGSAGLLALVLSVSGVQYTFGRICYLIPNHDQQVFWWPLLGVSVASLLLQAGTIGYCVARTVRPWFHYCKLRWSGVRPSADEERLISSLHTASKVRKVVQMQWRAIMIPFLVMAYVCYLTAVMIQLHRFDEYPHSARLAWFKCLASSKGDKAPCASLASALGPSEPELFAVLYMLELSGLLAIALLSRSAMYRAWYSLLKGDKRSFAPPRRWADSPPPVETGDDDVESTTQASYRFSELTVTPSSDAGSLVKAKTAPRQMT